MAAARAARPAVPGGQAHTCGWSDCPACRSLVRFVERVQAGEVASREPVTSAWWGSEAAADLYRRNVNLPPCQHPPGGEDW
jgi:hypothetical protein